MSGHIRPWMSMASDPIEMPAAAWVVDDQPKTARPTCRGLCGPPSRANALEVDRTLENVGFTMPAEGRLVGVHSHVASDETGSPPMLARRVKVPCEVPSQERAKGLKSVSWEMPSKLPVSRAKHKIQARLNGHVQGCREMSWKCRRSAWCPFRVR